MAEAHLREPCMFIFLNRGPGPHRCQGQGRIDQSFAHDAFAREGTQQATDEKDGRNGTEQRGHGSQLARVPMSVATPLALSFANAIRQATKRIRTIMVVM